MALIEESVVDKMEILEDGTIQVRTNTRIIREETGEVVANSFHRHVLPPGADVSNEVQKVKDVAGAMHTAERVAAYQAKLAANENGPL